MKIDILVETNRKNARLSFKDNGIGIEKKHQRKIFDMFYRAATGSPGSGIGLYIVKEILNKLEGQVKMESEWQKGTIIRITLPNLNQRTNGAGGRSN